MNQVLSCAAAPFANIGYSINDGVRVGGYVNFDVKHNARQLPEFFQPVGPVAGAVAGGVAGTVTAVIEGAGGFIPSAVQYWLWSGLTGDGASCQKFNAKGEPWDFNP